MCGIVAYIGQRNSVPIVLEGLRRLEYRGYDSAGIALVRDGELYVQKNAGKVADLAARLAEVPGGLEAQVGMGHTRWATHGEPNDTNAHPHWDGRRKIALIHNGIIENYQAIKTKLLRDGHTFLGNTDTEVLAHLVGVMHERTRNLCQAVRQALQEVDGTYGLVVMSPEEPDTLVVARKGSPLIIGVGEGEHLVASDASALVEHTRQVVYL